MRSTVARRRRAVRLAGWDPVAIALVAALALATLALAHWAGVKRGPAFDALPDLLRASGAALALFAVCGHAVAVRLVPSSLRGLRHLLVLPLGAMVASLGLTVLGFLHVPLTASLAMVLAGGAAASLLLTRDAERGAGVDWAVAGFVAVGALAAALSMVPSFRAGFATVPGLNPDAHLVTGIAELFEHAPPRATRLGLPVTELPDVWRSKYPIFYALAGVSRLSGLDPLAAFPAVAGLLCAFVAVGFGLVAIDVLGLSRRWGIATAAALGLDVGVLHLALHPYWNQLWGLATFPFALVFAWRSVHDRDPRASALFVGVLVTGALAYPLALPYPLVALAAFSLAERRWPALPGWVRTPWALGALLVAVALAIPFLGVGEKVVDGVDNLFGGGKSLWTGDVHAFVGAGRFVGVGGGWLPAAAVAAFAALALARALPRRQAAALAGLLALCALADLRLRLDDAGAYFDLKHLTFTGPLVLTLGVAGVAWLAGRRRALPVGVAAAALVAYPLAAGREARAELRGTYEQVTTQMLALRHWSAALPRNASVRLDIAPSGYQLWAAYFLAAHPLDSPQPVVGTTYPHVAPGYRADYALSLAPRLAAQLAASGLPSARAPGRVGKAVFRNRQFVLRTVLSAPGPATATRARF